MEALPDYAEMSSPTTGLGIDLDISGIAPIRSGLAVRDGGAGRGGAPRDARRSTAREEPLVDAGRDLRCVNCYHSAGWPGTSPTTWLRQGNVVRLLELQLDLPDGFGLAVFDGWRSTTTIRALYDRYYGPGSTLEPGYLAEPVDEPAEPPPHLTGGAVDLTLSWMGVPLSLGTPFDEFTPRAHLTALDDVPDDHPDALDRDLRRLLFDSMTEAGFAPYAQEWWHFSYGDRDWARWHGRSEELYGATAPNR